MLREFEDGRLNQRVTEVFLEEMVIGLNFGEWLGASQREMVESDVEAEGWSLWWHEAWKRLDQELHIGPYDCHGKNNNNYYLLTFICQTLPILSHVIPVTTIGVQKHHKEPTCLEFGFYPDSSGWPWKDLNQQNDSMCFRKVIVSILYTKSELSETRGTDAS